MDKFTAIIEHIKKVYLIYNRPFIVGFSGGKDSIYAIYLAQKQGYSVDNLICLLPSLPRPSPHAANIECIKVLANSMKKPLTIIK